VETDKATMEVNGYVDGTLLYIGVPEGQAAKVNQIIAIVGKAGEDYKPLLDEDGAKSPEAAAKPADDNKNIKEDQQASNATAGTETKNKEQSTAKVSLPEGAKEIRCLC
jgi:pyruvate dehydrogenase E2 component (dihydrolipoamide acetyltransferase)